MVSSVSTVNSPGGLVTAPASLTPAPNAQLVTPPLAPIHNPLVIHDPTAGFITEYLNATGSQIISQTPSAIAVAYLRLGLAADGTVKNNAAGSVRTTA